MEGGVSVEPGCTIVVIVVGFFSIFIVVFTKGSLNLFISIVGERVISVLSAGVSSIQPTENVAYTSKQAIIKQDFEYTRTPH